MLARLADEEVTELAKVDQAAHRDFGSDESTWMPWHWRQYWIAIDKVHVQFPHGEAAS
ncbi:hypothetical protein ABZ916_39485 [Streptomyces sp. NPDC046853]|uniref:hypothetical protein n=1 Tax=Streptomyces sp. NPDC046853 TaxID=3154920 RepID=UPI0033E839B3